MNKKQLATLVTTVLAVMGTSQAYAADGVQMYGKLDMSMHWQKNRHSNGALSMLNEGSRWGMNITETLSPDVSIRGYLETGFNADNGALSNTGGGNVGTTLFDRRSVLAVRSNQYGEVGFGRMGSVRSTISPYGQVLGNIDPMETAYGDIASISQIFGNDPRGNNTISYLSPDIQGWRGGATYSFASADQEADATSKNNRLFSVALRYQGATFGVFSGASYLWFGEDGAAATLADKGKAYDREDAVAYSLGATWQATEQLKLFLAGQYQKNWRSVAGLNVEKIGNATQGDRQYGIDGVSALVGFQYRPYTNVRVILDYLYFDGDHQMGNGSSIDAKRHIANLALEYRLSKRTMVYTTLHRSIGREALNQDQYNSWIYRVGLQHWF